MVVTLEDRLVVGDGSALRDLFDQYAPLISAIAADTLGPDRSDAVDTVTADVVAEAWNARSEFDPSKGSVLAWLVAMTRVRLADELAMSVAEADETHGSLIDRHLVAAVIGSMASTRAELVNRGLFGGAGEEAMAAEFDMPLGSVAGHLRRGLETLRDELGDSLPPGPDAIDRLEAAVAAGPPLAPSAPVGEPTWMLVMERAAIEESVGSDEQRWEDLASFDLGPEPDGLVADGTEADTVASFGDESDTVASFGDESDTVASFGDESNTSPSSGVSAEEFLAEVEAASRSDRSTAALDHPGLDDRPDAVDDAQGSEGHGDDNLDGESTTALDRPPFPPAVDAFDHENGIDTADLAPHGADDKTAEAGRRRDEPMAAINALQKAAAERSSADSAKAAAGLNRTLVLVGLIVIAVIVGAIVATAL